MKSIRSVLAIGASLLLLAFGQSQAHAYTHPGSTLSLADLQAVKAKIDANQAPWKYAYDDFAMRQNSSYGMRGPTAIVSRSPDVNLHLWKADMTAIWNMSLMWYFTGDNAYAQRAHDVLLAWANTQTEFSGQESMLTLGDYAPQFVGAAEILRGTWPGWTEADTITVKAYFANVLMPGANPWGESMYGAANKGALAMMAQGLMGIFNDDTVTVDRIAYQARTLAHVGLRSSNDIGMLGDSLRDQGHAHVQLNALTVLAEALWKQGIDIYSDHNNRLLAAGEYYARVNDLSVATPFLPFGTTDAYYQSDVTNHGFHAGATAFSILHNAYVVRKGLTAPNMARRLQEMPPSWLFLKDADLSTATPPALAIPATTSITSGFSDAEIDGASPAGNSSYSGGIWTVQGTGWSIWGPNDDGCHFTYKAVTGDCAIIAKVESVQHTHNDARAGVMLRTSLSAGAPRVWMAVTPRSVIQQNIQGIAVYAGNNYGNKVAAGIPQPSYWVKLERLGDIVTGSISPDGTNWAATEVGRLDNSPATWYVGLVVSSTSGSLNTSTFSNVQITGGNGGAPIVTPAAPAAFLAAAGENAVSLRWQPSFGATGYTIKRATSSGGTYSTIASGVTGSSYTDTTATNGTTYYYVVNATNSAGTSANSAEDSATPFSPMVNLAFSGTATSSMVGGPSWEQPSIAFDRSSAWVWTNANASNPGPAAWLRYDFGTGNAQTVKRYTVVSAGTADRDPKTWTFQGSNDGSTWTTLDTQSDQSFVNRNHANTYNLGTPAAYRYYQIDVTANNGGTALANAELGFWSDTGRTLADGTYRLLNRHSGKAFEVAGGSVSNGAQLVQQTYNGADSQQWDIAWLGNGQYRLLGVASGKAVDVSGGSQSDGANLIISSWSGSNNQQWTVTPTGDGFHKLTAVHSGKVADVSGGSTADGADIIQETHSGSDSQQWMLAVATAPLPIPPAPTGVGATPATLSQINLSWTASPGAISYNIKRATVSGGPYTQIAESVNITNYTSTGLSADTTYYYVVAAVNGSGESADSAQASATTLATPPDAPTDLTAIVGTNQIVLNWTLSAGTTSYNVKRATTSGGPYTTVATGVTSTTYTDTGPTNGVTYYYIVSASNAVGTSPDSVEVSVVLSDLVARLKFDETAGAVAADSSGNGFDAALVNAPAWATGFLGNSVNLPATASQHVTLPAGIVSGLTDFTISTWVKIGAFATNSRIFDFGTSTTPDATAGAYMFLTPQYTTGTNAAKMRFAITTAGYSNEKAIVSSTALAAGAWAHVAVTRSGNTGSLYLNGTLVGSSTGITVSPENLGSTTRNYLGRSQYSGDPYLNGAIDDFRIYNRALTVGEISTLSQPAAGAPTGLAVVADNGQATLTWFPNATSSYTVKRGTTSGGPYTTVATGLTATTYTDTGLTNGATYYYVVSGANAQGSGPDSAEVSVTPSIWRVHLKFDESDGTTAADSSGLSNDATLVNAPTFTAGKIANALTLASSSTQYATLPASSVQGAGAVTIMAWVKPTTVTTHARVFDFGTSTVPTSTSGAYMFLAPTNGSVLRFAITSSGYNNEQKISGTAPLAAGVWSHVAVTLDGSVGRLYLNGAQVGSNSAMTLTPASLGTLANLYLGKSQFSGDPYLNGSLDDFRIYGYAMDATEVAAHSAPLDAPQNLTAAPGHAQVALSWDAVSGASGYTVRRSAASNGTYSDLALEIPATSYTDTGLSDGATWYYTVSAHGLSGEGQASDPVAATTHTAVESWRYANFGTTSNSGNAADSVDPDGDGMTNAEEYIAGTNPNSTASVLRINTVMASATDVVVSFPSVSGKTYRLERSDTLQAGSWTTVLNNIAGTGGILQVTDFGAAAQDKHFYRIVTP